MDTAAADVFLSYSRTDAAAVRRVQGHLQAAGLATFLDRDHLAAGQPWLPALEQAIARCGAVAVFVGPAGLGTWQQREVQLALDRQAEAERTGRRLPVIPVLLPKVEDPPGGFLKLHTWVDLRADLADPVQLQRLLTGLRGVAPADARTIREAFCPTAACCRFGRKMPASSSVARRRSTRSWPSSARTTSSRSWAVPAAANPRSSTRVYSRPCVAVPTAVPGPSSACALALSRSTPSSASSTHPHPTCRPSRPITGSSSRSRSCVGRKAPSAAASATCSPRPTSGARTGSSSMSISGKNSIPRPSTNRHARPSRPPPMLCASSTSARCHPHQPLHGRLHCPR